VILINLLPHREAARKRRKEEFQILMGVGVLVGLAFAGLIYLWFQGLIGDQQWRNGLLRTEIQKLDDQIKEIASLEGEISALRARQKAVEDLQADRNLPVHMLTELVAQLPDGVYVTNLNQVNEIVSLRGMAESNERVSEMLRNLSDNTPWFAKPELLEIVAGSVALTPRDNRPVASFNMRFRLVRGSEHENAENANQAEEK